MKEQFILTGAGKVGAGITPKLYREELEFVRHTQ